MKRIVSAIIIASILVSCSDGLQDQGGAIVPPSGSVEAASDVFIPVFFEKTADASGIATAGIIDMTPDGSPFANTIAATSVMSTLPVMVSLDLVENTTAKNVFDSVEDEFLAYGFPVRFDRENSRKNNDGVYMKYYVMSEQKGNGDFPIGCIDYYYSDKTERFSYREIIMLNIDFSGTGNDSGKLISNILVIQYDDIPVEWVDGRAVFECGQIGADGTAEKNGTVDLIGFNSHGCVFSINRDYTIIRSDGKTFYQIYAPYYSVALRVNGYPPQIDSILSKYTQVEDHTFTVEEANETGMNLINEILPVVYKNKNVKDTYHSYSSYRNDMLTEFSKDFEPKRADDQSLVGRDISVGDCASTIFDYETGEVAALGLVQLMSSVNYSSIGEKEHYDQTNFESFFPCITYEKYVTPNDNGSDDADMLIKALIEAQLRVCGIDKENFIRNFIVSEAYSFNTSGYGDFQWTSIPVDCSDPADFEAKLKERYATTIYNIPIEQVAPRYNPYPEES